MGNLRKNKSKTRKFYSYALQKDDTGQGDENCV